MRDGMGTGRVGLTKAAADLVADDREDAEERDEWRGTKERDRNGERKK